MNGMTFLYLQELMDKLHLQQEWEKKFLVFIERIEKQVNLLKTIPFNAKFGGATGNFNAHHVAFPEIDWKKFCK